MAQAKLDTLQQVEVSEGVDILLRPAGPVIRAYAFFIDSFFYVCILFLLAMLYTFLGSFLGLYGQGFYLLLIFLLSWGYFAGFEAGRRGATPGKRLMGLRVVRSSGAEIGWGPSILRNLLRVVDMAPLVPFVVPAPVFPSCMVGLLCVMFTRKFQRLGDMVADTVVVYDDAKKIEYDGPPLAVSIAPQVPPMVLSREEQQALVLYLERAGMWSDARREELAAHADFLTHKKGREAVIKLLAMGIWVRDS